MSGSYSGIENRLYLIDENRHFITTMLRDMEPAAVCVLVGDLRDPLARNICEAAARRKGLDYEKERAALERRNATIPTMILVVSVADARALLADPCPEIAAKLTIAPARGSVRVVATCDGASSLVHTRLGGHGPAGSA